MDKDTPIAVIGLAYRAPGIGGKGLWEYLEQARSAWTKFPKERFDRSAYGQHGDERSGVFTAEGAHFLPDDIFAFDAGFFHMRTEEARTSDPQHRLMLECALEAAEDAGKSLLDLAGKKIGVFIGSGQHEYSQRLGDDHHATNTFSATGVAPCMVSNRISYFFDIDGPSVVLDAACASSVYAAHQAVSAIRNGECNAAFVGAAALSLGPGGWLALEKTGALSTHGRSYSYDEKAAGFGRGEGAACLLIKRIDDAIRDGDPIQAVIRSSACNHGGRSEGITMPNGSAHRKLLETVHEIAGLDPSETPVVEGHGTGTAVGDPIEAGAFAAVLGKNRTSSNPIYLGSVKSNFGHLEGASGILSMVKAILMLKNGTILPTAGFEKINPKILGKEKLVVPEAPIPWPAGEPRRVMVTNFGFGGSNSAIILEEASAWLVNAASAKKNGVHGVNGSKLINGRENASHNTYTTNGTNGTNGTDATNGTNGIHQSNGIHTAKSQSRHDAVTSDPRLFVLSARNEKSLTSYLSSFDEYLDEIPESGDMMTNLSYTLGQRRTHFPYRVSTTATSIESLQEKLSTAKPVRARDHTLVFAFTGQGAQNAQMASGLQRYPAFAQALKEAESHLKSMGATWGLAEELSRPSGESRVHEAEISQPACTAVQLALVMLLRSWNINPSIVTGHSSGEIAAAFAANLISFETAVAVSYFRGQAAAILGREQKRPGAMLAIGVGSPDALKLIDQHSGGHYATVAAINSPRSVTISGDELAIELIHKAADEQGLFVRKLAVQMAYHSRHMEKVADFYQESITPYCNARSSAHESTPDGPKFVSSLAGSELESNGLDASYWVQNLIRPVKFADALQTIFSSQRKGNSNPLPYAVLEIGPHAALKSPIQQTASHIQSEGSQTLSFEYVPSLKRGEDSVSSIMSLAGTLFTLGAPILPGEVNQTNLHNAEVVTGLPAYAWDKSISYEVRPRATQQKFFPGEPFHPLLGRKIPIDGGKQRAYRQVFTLDEMPWIRDHVVAGATIFPMTGYMSCAIEAARRTLSSPAASFLVQDFHVTSRMEILEGESVDMVTRLWPAEIGNGSFSSTTWSFEISTWKEATEWTVHAFGRIEPETVDLPTETPTIQACLPLVDTNVNLIEHDIAHAYEYAGVRATQYGPTFRNSVRFFEGDGFTRLEHRLRDLGAARRQPGPHGSYVTVDPPTLDGFLQGGGPLQKTEDGKRPAQMPNYIRRFRISNSIPSEPNQRLDIVTRLLDYDYKGGRMQISVAVFLRRPDGSSHPIAEWESVAFRSIGSADDEPDPVMGLPDSWVWDLIPKVDLLDPAEVTEMFQVQGFDEAQLKRMRNLEAVASFYLYRGLKETAQDHRTMLPFHLSRFVNWAKRYVSQHNVVFDTEPTQLIAEVRSHDAQGEMLCAIGERLVPILREEVEPLEIMLADGLLARHYEADVLNERLSKVLGDVVLNLSDIEPNLRILEIGAGTAGTTLPVLETLSKETKQGAFLEYTFTDISSGFFENARTKLAKWSQRIVYKKLDISQDPLSQGFNPEEYDIIIAANVLHATQNMATTMKNLRSLLRPRGKVLVLEANHHPAGSLPFILLPGWWYAEDDYRDLEEGPLMPVNVWNRLFLDTGFSGVDICIQGNYQADVETMSIMCSSKTERHEETRSIVVCGTFEDDEEVDFAQTVADALSSRHNYAVDIKPFAEIEPSRDFFYIFVDSAEKPLLQDVSAERFQALKNLLIQNAGLLWVLPPSTVPESKMIKGLLRTLRIESNHKGFLSFDEVPRNERGADGIVKLVPTLCDPAISRAQDQDFVWHKGSIHLPRMRMVGDAKERLAVEQGISYRKMQGMWKGERALEMTTEAAGSADSIYFRRTEDLDGPLADDDIIVQVEAAGASRRDLDLVQGAIPWAAPGFDGAGKVVKVGSGVADLQEGDRVFFLALKSSAFSTYKRMPAWHAARIPGYLSSTDAASMPLAFSLAVLALIRTAQLEKDEAVLIHSAAGAVGQACVVIAKHLGARVFVTAGTDEKRAFLHDTLGVPRHQIFSSRTHDFRDKILCETGGKGVDVIVNSLGGELLADTWSLAAQFGRFVEIDKKAAFQNISLPMRSFFRNVTFSSIDVRDLFAHRPGEVKKAFSEVVRLLRDRVIGPIQPVTLIPISNFSSCLRKLRSGDNMGKIVVTLGSEEQVLAESDQRPMSLALKSDATYLITGGTRGIGLNLAYWMIEHGARNVVVLGRSGASGHEVQKLLDKYAETDVCVRALACDIGSRAELANVVESIKDLPPVQGVVHSALLLSDKFFERAEFEDWETITGPRVRGAWNLHELMPRDLDFFIALGSFLGDTGNEGQAIYAGTAAFYDAFAQYRNACGQHTVSIGLAVVLDVGYVADRNLSNSLEKTLGATLTMADIRTIVKGVVGKSDKFYQNGKTNILKLYREGKAVLEGPWRYIHPVLATERLKADGHSGGNAGAGGAANLYSSWTAAVDPLEGLTEALITKIATMAIMDREEVQADVPVSSYNLDSLVSVELRNWIRRETGVELLLSAITHAESIGALATDILEQRGGATDREKVA